MARERPRTRKPDPSVVPEAAAGAGSVPEAPITPPSAAAYRPSEAALLEAELLEAEVLAGGAETPDPADEAPES